MALYKDFGSNLRTSTPGGVPSVGGHDSFIGHVLEIVLDETHRLYKSPIDIGKIVFRDVSSGFINKPKEETIKVEAYPLDRSFTKFPLPGEQVIIHKAFSDLDRITGVLGQLYFYTFNVTNTHNITYNSIAFLNTDYADVKTDTPRNILRAVTNKEEYDQRFDNKIKDLNLFKQNNDTLVYKQLRPYEGDFILQGRFGQSLRLGASSTGNPAKWSENTNSGNSVLVMRVNRDVGKTEDESYLTVEDLNTDDSSLWMTTNNKAELQLACATELRTWKYTYKLDKESKDISKDDSVQIVDPSGIPAVGGASSYDGPVASSSPIPGDQVVAVYLHGTTKGIFPPPLGGNLPYDKLVHITPQSDPGVTTRQNIYLFYEAADSWRAMAKFQKERYGRIIAYPGSTYRTVAEQKACRDANGCPDYTSPSSTCRVPTAPMDTHTDGTIYSKSPHGAGLAVDVTDVSGNVLFFQKKRALGLEITKEQLTTANLLTGDKLDPTKVRSFFTNYKQGSSPLLTQAIALKFLDEYGTQFGWFSIPSESWHIEYRLTGGILFKPAVVYANGTKLSLGPDGRPITNPAV